MRTLQSELITKGLHPQKQPSKKNPNKKHPKKRKHNRKTNKQPQQKTNTENLSFRDWEEIMGVRKPKFKRNKGGAFKQI